MLSCVGRASPLHRGVPEIERIRESMLKKPLSTPPKRHDEMLKGAEGEAQRQEQG